MPQQDQSVNATRIGTILHTDNAPIDQPKARPNRFALNAVNEVTDGGQRSLSNELSNIDITHLPSGFYPIGDCYVGDDLSVVLSVNPTTGYEEIGLLDKNSNYNTVVHTKVLGLSIRNQCDVRFRLRRGSERVIYWVDGLNKARTFNIDRPHNFYNSSYQAYIKGGGNPATYTGEKWDGSSFDLTKSYKTIPFFADVKIVETGGILPGSYNFAVQYVDEDLNPTEWITTSNPVRIYNDTTNNAYERIRGSKNIDSVPQQFGRANKSIRLTLTNLDTNFPYYRVAIIRAAGLNGKPDKVLASELYSTTDGNFIYSGNDHQLKEVALGDILIDREVIYAPRHIEQTENRLTLAYTQGKNINWCDFQAFASKIGSDLTTKEVLLNNTLSDANSKNAKATFMYRGYMPGEVHSFGIVYIFSDGYTSPVFHIPGKGATNTASKMKFYEGEGHYLDIHNCSTDNYWGKDINGKDLVNQRHRHHRFPFRKEVNKPLVKSTVATTGITKYKLTVSMGLTGIQPYPVDAANDPLVINYAFNYHVTGASQPVSYSGNLRDTDLGTEITLYDDVVPLDKIYSNNTKYGQLDPSCGLTAYQQIGSEVFAISINYTPYTQTTSYTQDSAEIFGIEFSNIEKPHPDVIGFYIVRNERNEDDKIIVDNAIFGSMTEYQQYKSFGILTPKQYFPADNCGRQGDAGKSLSFFKKGVWFFNPEFQFFTKKTDFDRIEVEGVYNESSIEWPTDCHEGGGSSRDDLGGAKGVYINDVQAGTSYDPEVNKRKSSDDDGFDLIIGFKNTSFTFALDTGNTLVFPTKRIVLYLNAASYQNLGGDTYYNVSIDNKIGQFITTDDIATPVLDKLHTDTGNKNGLVYGSLVKDNKVAYSNFITRPYYKEHNNPIYFGTDKIKNGVKVFNGDAEISALNIVSSVFHDIVVADRAKKNKTWKIIVGAVLVVASVAATILTAGAAAPAAIAAIASLSALAISYGVSLISSGIKFEQFKNMVDVDYEKGLKETVTDGGIFYTIRGNLSRRDDTIRWFCDRVSNVYIESSVPFALRAGLTSGVTDFIDAPATYNEDTYKTYLTEKLTAVDRDQGSGRLYKGFAGAEYYDVNLDYCRFNREKVFIHLPIEYDCCSDKNEIFPTRIWYSEQSFQEEKVDNYCIFLPNNYRDIEGEHGEITNLYKLGNNLFIETKEALWQLPQNNQERVTGEIVSFIGTGEFFSIPPRKVLDDTLGSGGTQHKWATIKTQYGVLSVNEIKNKIYLHGEGLKDITIGNRNWFKNNLKPYLTTQLYNKFGVEYLHRNNPANPNGVGYLSCYDTRHERILVTKKDYRLLQEKLDVLIMVNGYTPIANDTKFVYDMSTGLFYHLGKQVKLDNADYFENKSWTISYSFYEDGFISQHSYLPNYYIYNQNNFYSFVDGSDAIWKHNVVGKVQTFYNKFAPFIVEYVVVNNPLVDHTFEDLTLHTRARRWDATEGTYLDEDLITFNKIILFNSKQSTGECIMKVKQSQPNPAGWYSQQTVNSPGVLLLERSGKNWNINRLRDYVIDYAKPLFTTNWSVLRSSYPIDKVVNPTVINHKKPWQDLQPLRDKYVIIRLKFDNFNDVNLSFSYSIDNQPMSK